MSKPVIGYVVVNAWAEWCGSVFDTKAEAEADMVVCQRIRPDLTFRVAGVTEQEMHGTVER